MEGVRRFLRDPGNGGRWMAVNSRWQALRSGGLGVSGSTSRREDQPISEQPMDAENQAMKPVVLLAV